MAVSISEAAAIRAALALLKQVAAKSGGAAALVAFADVNTFCETNLPVSQISVRDISFHIFLPGTDTLVPGFVLALPEGDVPQRVVNLLQSGAQDLQITAAYVADAVVAADDLPGVKAKGPK